MGRPHFGLGLAPATARAALFAWLHVLLLCASASRAAVVGYQEGARHRVECTGFVRGLQLHFTSYTNPEFTEPYLIGVRVMCSTARMNVEHWGAQGDDRIFGSEGTLKAVECPKGQGIAAISWRPATATKADAPHATKIGGVRVFCDSESSTSPLVADMNASNFQPVAYTSTAACSATTKPPTGPRAQARDLEFWFHQDLTGFSIEQCQ